MNISVQQLFVRRLALLVTAVLLAGCSDNAVFDPPQPNPNPGPGNGGSRVTFNLQGNYANPPDRTASFTITSRDSALRIDQSRVSLLQIGNRVDIILNNLTISDTVSYILDSVAVREEIRPGEFVRFSEFEAKRAALTRIAVVLVLDVSRSLGDDFPRVKSYAQNFVRLVKTNLPEAQIGVVAFATGLEVHNISNDTTAVLQYIGRLQQGEFTALYDAMNQGIDMLRSPALVVDARALVTFTDGRDNASRLDLNPPDSLVVRLNRAGISSFTIGFNARDAVDEQVLQQLAVKGVFELASDVNRLRRVFDIFSRAVANIYRVTYTRNDQIISAPRALRFEFLATPNT